MPGSSTIRSSSTPRARASADALGEAARPRRPPRRRSPGRPSSSARVRVCVTTSAAPRCGAGVGQLGLAQAAHVVDHRGAGRQRARAPPARARCPPTRAARRPRAAPRAARRGRSPPRPAPPRCRCARTRRPRRRSRRRRPPAARPRSASSSSASGRCASENESGVAFTIPISTGSARSVEEQRSRRRQRSSAASRARRRAARPAAARAPRPAPPRASARARARPARRPSRARRPARAPPTRAPLRARSARARRASSRPSRVRRSSTSAERAAPARARRRRPPRPRGRAGSGLIALAELGCRRRQLQHVLRGVAVAGGQVGAALLVHPSSSGSSAGSTRQPQRDLVRAAGRLAALALDDPVDRQLRHPPPGGELAAGDRDEAGARLVELGLARDVDGLLRVAGRDQRPHPGVGAREVAGAEGGAEERVDRVEQVVHVVGRGRHVLEARPRSRCRSCRRACGRATGSTNTVRPPPAGTITPASHVERRRAGA